MSKIQVKAFFKFCRVKVTNQTVDLVENTVMIDVVSDKRYNPICSNCKQHAQGIHSYKQRVIRERDILGAKTFVSINYRIVQCFRCGYVVEDTGLMEPFKRVTKRFANYILDLCKIMTIKDVAKHLDLDWKTVKDIHKNHLIDVFSRADVCISRILVVDEISIRKGHQYLTIIADWDSGRVLWTGEGRKYETLKGFFDSLSDKQRSSIEAIAMDMWDPYIKAVHEGCPYAKIVFDQFHVVAAFGRVINKVRNAEYKKAHKSEKEVMKGSKYILLKNRDNLSEQEKPRLKAILNINEALTVIYILKDYLKKLWRYKYTKCAENALEHWCALAYESGIKAVISFAKTLRRYAYGIINHCRFPIHTSRMEGINNKIKVIKRKAYGFHDMEYFGLVIKSAFAHTN